MTTCLESCSASDAQQTAQIAAARDLTLSGSTAAQPLARELGLPIDARFASEEVKALLAAVALVDGPVLLSWQHSNMVDIARQLCPAQQPAPEWRANCFDQTWIFTEAEGHWTMACIAQQLLQQVGVSSRSGKTRTLRLGVRPQG